MAKRKVVSSLSVFDYAHNKLCDLYDSQNNLDGQAFGISFETNMTDGIKDMSFTIPYRINKEKNFRWDYIKSEYLIRLIYDGKTEWYIAQKPTKHKEKNGIYGDVACSGLEVTLKTKNIYKEFDDENGIGTLSDLADKVLAGTGWSRGYTDPMLELDGVTEKVRSLNSGNKQGALGLITTLCSLFKCFPIYKTDTKQVEFYNYNNRMQVLEGRVGYNLDALNVNYNSTDICTRLYVEGEYGEDGYIGIDSVNPTGLTYIMNFDYYREIGVFTQDHEAALDQYLTDILDVKNRISANMALLIEKENEINNLIGQCKLVVYFVSEGWTTPKYEYGEMTTGQKTLASGDDVLVLKNDGTYRYATIETTPDALIETGEYGIVKFVTKAAGAFGANEVQVEAKEKEISNLERKIAVTIKPDKIAEYEAEIARLEEEIETIFTKEDGLYAQMHDLVKVNGLFEKLGDYKTEDSLLQIEQDDIESDFIIAMGDMLRDGYWNDQNYVEGQELHLFNDATERMNILSRPDVEYSFNLVRLSEEFGIPIEDFQLNSLFRIHDPDLDVHENLFVTKITIGVDDESYGNITVSNKDITMNTNSLGALLSRMSQLSDLIEQKNTLYDRAKAIAKNGTFYTDRLNGQIDVLKTQILSTVSNWHTDEQGNIMFLSADGGSAMMLSGAGFMIANSKDDDGNWVWRTFGSGEGFTADEIVAGFISAERIESGSISTDKVEPGFGGSLVLTGNPSITALNEQIAPAFVEGQAYTAGQYVNYNGAFYVFTADFAGGTFTEALPYVSETSVATEIELMPDKIIQYVGSKGYSKTYLSDTDPTLDPNNHVAVGDYWIVEKNKKTWGTLKLLTWQAVKDKIWGALTSNRSVYYWSGTRWVQVYDQSVIVSAFTQITQTRNMILQEAERADGAYIARTQNMQTADAIVLQAEKGSAERLAIPFTVEDSYAVGDIVSYGGKTYRFTIAHVAGPWNDAHVTEVIVTDYTYPQISGIKIEAAGIEVTGNKYIKLQSGGYVDIDANGYIKMNNWKVDGVGLTYYSGSTALMQFGRNEDRINGVKAGVFVQNAESQQYDPDVILYSNVTGYGYTHVVLGYANGGPAFYPDVSGYPSGDAMKLGSPSKRWWILYVMNIRDCLYAEIQNLHYTYITQDSSRDIKHDIQDMPSMGDMLDQLRPVTYIYDKDVDENKRYGLIYEEALPVLPDICSKDENEKAINYMELVPMLLKEIQDLRRRVTALERS